MACTDGGVAQLGEHLLCKQGVVGSIPSASTNDWCREGREWLEAPWAEALDWKDCRRKIMEIGRMPCGTALAVHGVLRSGKFAL